MAHYAHLLSKGAGFPWAGEPCEDRCMVHE